MDISVKRETGALKVLSKVSSIRRRWLQLWDQDFELPRVDTWLNSSTATFPHRYPDARFNYLLRDLFLIVLTWGVINIMLFHHIGTDFVQAVFIFVQLFAAVVFFSKATKMVKMMMETMGSTTPVQTDEMRSISSSPPPPPLPPPVVQHV